MKTYIQILGLFFLSLAQAETTWLCKEESSRRQGDDTVLACGIGIASDENEARLQAFDNAKLEFDKLCKASDDCQGRPVSIEPKRTTCEQDSDQIFKCYRLLAFTITKPQVQKDPVTGKVLTKVTKGITKQELLVILGTPSGVIRVPGVNSRLQFLFRGQVCRIEGAACYVILQDGKVIDYKDLKPVYDGDI